jgi:hypothetical protein
MISTRRILFALLFIIALPAQAVELGDLLGTWQLASASRTIVATGLRTNYYGPAPRGFLTYGKDGRMSVIIVDTSRPKPADAGKVTDAEGAALFRTVMSYAGTFTVEGAIVRHLVDISWNEATTGTTQVRHARLEGDTLVISTDPQPSSLDGQTSVTELKWTKVREPAPATGR